MVKGIDSEVSSQGGTVDMMEWLGRTALELIGQGVLGVQMDTLGEPTPNPLADSIKMIM